MATWEIAAGAFGRDYSQFFLRHGMAFMGCEFWDSLARVRPGDIAILKRGISEIVAVGEIVSRDGRHNGLADVNDTSKEWLWDFDGWELPAWCYVDWHEPAQPINASALGLAQGTIRQARGKELLRIADETMKSVSKRPNIQPEPPPTREVKQEDMIGSLIDLGLRVGAADDVTEELRRIRLLVQFYKKQKNYIPNEHEIRTFLTVPFLLSLGWAEQAMKIELPVPEGGRADVACFTNPFKGRNDKCVLLIETKNLGEGLDYAPK
jgi:hypothetical protein